MAEKRRRTKTVKMSYTETKHAEVKDVCKEGTRDTPKHKTGSEGGEDLR